MQAWGLPPPLPPPIRATPVPPAPSPHQAAGILHVHSGLVFPHLPRAESRLPEPGHTQAHGRWPGGMGPNSWEHLV